MKRVILITLSTLIVACSESRIANLEEQFRTKTFKVTPQKVVDLEEYDILNPDNVLKCGNDYVFTNLSVTEGKVSVLFGNNRGVISGINQGGGPQEVSNFTHIYLLNDSIKIYDANYGLTTTLKYNKDSIYMDNAIKTSKIFAIGQSLYDDNYLLSPSWRDSCWLGFYTYDGQLLSSIDYVDDPLVDNLNLSQMNKARFFGNSITAISPDKKHFVCNISYGGYLLWGNIKGSKISVKKEYVYGNAKLSEKAGFYFWDEYKNLTHFLYSTASDKYAIVLYSGKDANECGSEAALNYGNTLLFYDWDGEPQFRLRLSKSLFCIHYDKNDNIIYGICVENEPELVIYNMNGIIK